MLPAPRLRDGVACEEGSSLGLGLERPEVSEAEVNRDVCCPRGLLARET